MARDLDRLEQLAFAQLIDLTQDRVRSRFPANGSFVQGKRGDVAYWYYQGYERQIEGSVGGKTRTYVGPVDDPATEKLRQDHETEHGRYRDRRRIAASLRRIGLPAPPPFDGAVLDAIQKSGVFDAGAILIGSMAFQTYSGLLGTKLEDALMQTGDIDVAQPRRVVVHLDSATQSDENLEVLLKKIDPTFAPILDRTHPNIYFGYKNQRDYKVEFLTSGARRTDPATSATRLKGVGGVSAQPVTFLEYLLEAPVRSVVLHDDGVPALVPDPARYAVHKLIVAHMRERIAKTRGSLPQTTAKIAKDVSQASSLISTFARMHRSQDIGLAWEEAWNRGPKWREHLLVGKAKMPPKAHDLLEHIVLSTVGPKSWPDHENSPPAPGRITKSQGVGTGRKKKDDFGL